MGGVVTFPARAWVFLRFYFPWTFAMGNPFEHSPWGILLRINHFVVFFLAPWKTNPSCGFCFPGRSDPIFGFMVSQHGGCPPKSLEQFDRENWCFEAWKWGTLIFRQIHLGMGLNQWYHLFWGWTVIYQLFWFSSIQQRWMVLNGFAWFWMGKGINIH